VKQLYYIRHGESQDNVRGIWGGRHDCPLTELGRQQAGLAAAKAKHDGLDFDLMIVSPLARAQQTADIVGSIVPIGRRETHDLLVERHFGDLELTEVDSFAKDHTYQDIDLVPNAETIERLQARAQKALGYIKSRPENRILVVSHSAFGRALKRCTLGLPWTAEYDQEVVALPHATIIQLI
jgi:broad specificity phosphatase PhoE